ncbi:MAG TPA: hypothetical protein VGH03_21080 [Caulobacteraceae bacterium]
MRAQHFAGPALIAAALLAAIPLAQVRVSTQPSGSNATQRDQAPSRAPVAP